MCTATCASLMIFILLDVYSYISISGHSPHPSVIRYLKTTLCSNNDRECSLDSYVYVAMQANILLWSVYNSVIQVYTGAMKELKTKASLLVHIYCLQWILLMGNGALFIRGGLQVELLSKKIELLFKASAKLDPDLSFQLIHSVLWILTMMFGYWLFLTFYNTIRTTCTLWTFIHLIVFGALLFLSNDCVTVILHTLLEPVVPSKGWSLLAVSLAGIYSLNLVLLLIERASVVCQLEAHHEPGKEHNIDSESYRGNSRQRNCCITCGLWSAFKFIFSWIVPLIYASVINFLSQKSSLQTLALVMSVTTIAVFTIILTHFKLQQKALLRQVLSSLVIGTFMFKLSCFVLIAHAYDAVLLCI